MTKLELLFDEVKKTYFTQWDIKHEWRAKLYDVKIFAGCCDMRNKTIFVDSTKWANSVKRGHYDGLYVLLIHEITHAVTLKRDRSDHGAVFQSRLQKIADKARDIGNINLANGLDAEVHQYKMRVPPHG